MMDDCDLAAEMAHAEWAEEERREALERALAESRAEVERLRELAKSYARGHYEAEARAERLAELLRKCRDEMAGLPRSLGYDFTHLPELDAALNLEPEA